MRDFFVRLIVIAWCANAALATQGFAAETSVEMPSENIRIQGVEKIAHDPEQSSTAESLS
jgi:hypothetical protein